MAPAWPAMGLRMAEWMSLVYVRTWKLGQEAAGAIKTKWHWSVRGDCLSTIGREISLARLRARPTASTPFAREPQREIARPDLLGVARNCDLGGQCPAIRGSEVGRCRE